MNLLNYEQLKQILTIKEGVAVVSSAGLTPNIADLLSKNNAGQPITILSAIPGDGDGIAETIVITGRSHFLNIPDLGVELRAHADEAGNVQLTLKYKLLGDNPGPNDWKFSKSFPTMPQIVDYDRPSGDPLAFPLDDLPLYQSYYYLTSQKQQEPDFKIELQTGINFVSLMRPTGIVGILATIFGEIAPFTLHGTIRLPANTDIAIPIPLQSYPWDAVQPVPGILLQADLGLRTTLSALTFEGAVFRVYAPHSEEWLLENDTYQPIFAYSGKLSIPSAELELDLTAPLVPGGNELLLLGQFKGVRLSKLAQLADIAGTDSLLSQLPEQIRSMGDALGKLELVGAGIELVVGGSGFEVAMTSLTIGMPDLNWHVWDDHFQIDRILSQFTVLDPFSRSASPSFEVSVFGTFEIEGVPIDIYADSRNGFQINAQLAEKQTIPLKRLMETYVPGVPAPSDLTINALSVSVAPARYYAMSLAMAMEPDPWVIDVGFSKLTIQDVVLAFTYPKGGPVAGTFGGSITFGDAFKLNVRYDIPGDFLIAGYFPEINLTRVLGKLVNQQAPIPSAFDLTLTQSSVMIQKKGANYTFLFATEMESLGTFAMEVRRVSGDNKWGFAAGLSLRSPRLSSLPGLGALSMFEDIFSLQNLFLIVSSFEDIKFTFPEVASFNPPEVGKGTIALPIRTGGVIAGLNLHADWVIHTGNRQQNLLKNFLGLDPQIGITLQVGFNPSKDSRLYVSYVTQIQSHPLTCQFGGQIQNGSVGLFLKGEMTVDIQNTPQTFTLELVFVANGALFSASMRGNQPIDFGVFQIGNLALEIGVNWEGIPSLGVAGSITSGHFDSSIAVFFDSTDVRKSMLAGSLSNLTLKDVLDTLTGDTIPSEINGFLDQVKLSGTSDFEIPLELADDLDNLHIDKVAQAFQTYGKIQIPSELSSLYVVKAEAGKTWFITDLTKNMRHYQIRTNTRTGKIEVSLEAQFYCALDEVKIAGLQPFKQEVYVNGKLSLFGLEAQATIDINLNEGIAIDATMSRIEIGGGKLFAIESHDGKSGPLISASTFNQPQQTVEAFRSPHFCLSGRMNLLGLTRDVYVNLSKDGLVFELNGQMTPFLYMDVHGHIQQLDNMGIGGNIKVGLNDFDLGPLGKVSLATGAEGALDIGVSGEKVTAAFKAGFQFAGQGFKIPFELDVKTEALVHIAETAWEKAKEALLDYLKDGAIWAELVAKKFIHGVENMVKVLQEYFHKTLEQAKAIVEKALEIAEEAAKYCAMTTAAKHL
ncbi:hypothetical protein GK047_12530 [Paenibacillus sp. SYP-B3998]|uniref:Uncharacterized protein n=1 Tax=Paenibacillus sp. SYP-B3998 TaxID=2678564 RepID=A0A6G3ZZK4_9BACL|nr:hypothetical protein [Paenibacillus sp. SYP-B3998]NEW06837.1 hypothetical protein [Paenibacillus sp. SYP-B3998]